MNQRSMTTILAHGLDYSRLQNILFGRFLVVLELVIRIKSFRGSCLRAVAQGVGCSCRGFVDTSEGLAQPHTG